VDQEKDEAYYQPDYWEGVEDALEEEFQLAVPRLAVASSRFSVLGGRGLQAVGIHSYHNRIRHHSSVDVYLYVHPDQRRIVTASDVFALG
jgi:hypothetical protein